MTHSDLTLPLFVSCPKGLEYLLEDELRELGLEKTRVSPHGVFTDADLGLLYRICLWSRLANRVHLVLIQGAVTHRHSLYQLCRRFSWHRVFNTDKTLAIEFHGESTHIRNTMFGAQVIKDAVVDYFQEQIGSRPTIARENPDIRLQAHLKHEQITISLDLTGYSLHQRGYRSQAGIAPLKENIAAAMLIRAEWPRLYAQGYALQDPCCGSGTIVIEAAMMAAKMAPGLLRDNQSFQHWLGHDPTLWKTLRVQAQSEIEPPKVSLIGSDHDATLIAKAQANAERAGVSAWVIFEKKSMQDCTATAPKGLLISNLPYGERLDDSQSLFPLYQKLGLVLHERFQNWRAAILTSQAELAKAIGLRAHKQYTLYNGALCCKLYCMTLDECNRLRTTAKPTSESLSSHAEMLANRLMKNHNHLKKWAKRQGIECYRVYDADLPEYNFAIDIYQEYAVLQEYLAPASISPEKAIERKNALLQVASKALNIVPDKLILKQRKPQKGKEQYQKLTESQHQLIIQEGLAKLKVNLYDYLDTGLFLDHRLLRLHFESLPTGTRFLNCYCYTASASVHAALAGAITTNVDLSNTYLNWAKDNFLLNHLDLRNHQFIQEDVSMWLRSNHGPFDVIFLDPPSFSNSKRMHDILDIQRDHELLIQSAMQQLTKQGILYFSTNFRRFRLSPQIFNQYHVVDISPKTIDIDFKRNSRIHQCYTIQH